MTQTPMDSAALIEAAEKLAPLLRVKAREAELARRPLDEVIDAVRQSGLFSLMVPKCYGGHEADVDTFFEVALTLSRADASMGWLVGFYIEHAYWLCGYPESFQKELFSDRDYVLAPATLNVAGGKAARVDGGYRLAGQWQWGTGVIHADWVLAGALVLEEGAIPLPYFFALPREEVEAVDTWHVAGMCGTGSFDIRIDDVFVPEARTVSMLELVNATGEASRLHAGPLYRTPLLPVLGFAGGLPMLGAAQMARDEYFAQTKAKLDASELPAGGADRLQGKPSVAAAASLSIDAAELVFRDVLADVMAQRNGAPIETRITWLTRLGHAVFMCREAVQDICSVTGASGSRLDNPIQRAMRDITTGSNHVIFDRESRYADYGRLLLGQPTQSPMA
ncbi:MAG: acyl-CoA dehydrogenase family protein [Myxococcota bacterium]